MNVATKSRPARARLLAVKPEAVEPKKPKVLVFGPPGVGKTWASLSWPSVFYVDTEGGADLDHYRAKLRDSGGVYLGPEQGSLDFDVVIDQVKLLATEEHGYRTIVIDSASKLWTTAISDEQEALGEKDVFGASKKAPTRKFAALVKWINKLDMNAIFICHQKELWGLNAQKQREQIGYTADIYDRLEYDLHLVLRIAKMGNSRYAYIGKSRLPAFPEGENFNWSYDEFALRYGRDVIEKEGAPLVLATPEQLAELAHLFSITKMPEDWQDKIFKKAGAEAWDEMNSDQVDACIKMLKGRLQS